MNLIFLLVVWFRGQARSTSLPLYVTYTKEIAAKQLPRFYVPRCSLGSMKS
jgi:hypothetical protein